MHMSRKVTIMHTKPALADRKTNPPISPPENGNKNGVASELTPQTAEERLLAKGGSLLTLDEVATLLNRDTEAIDDRRELGKLLAVEWNGEYQYPAWQFQDGKLLTGLDRVLVALKENDATPWTKIIFMTTEHGELDGFSPLDCLKKGDESITKEVVMQARREGQHGA
jgi:hypothetical protein